MTDQHQDQKDRVLDHDYDGICEYDNRLPNWWLLTLYGSIVFAFAYWLYAHTFEAAPSPDERLQAEMVKAAEAQLKAMEGKETTDQSLLLVAALPDRVAAGRKVYEQFCVVCHSQQGEGNVGPNLTDPYWIHGGRPLDIHRTITEGVPEKGMVAWGNQLGPLRVQDVTAYVISIKNTNVAGKAPQGEPETAAAGGDSAQVEGAPAPGPGVDDARTGAER